MRYRAIALLVVFAMLVDLAGFPTGYARPSLPRRVAAQGSGSSPDAVDDDLRQQIEIFEDSGDVTRLPVLDNDTGDTLTIREAGQAGKAQKGWVTLIYNELVHGNDLWYMPFPNANATDTFTYTVRDRQGRTDTATVTLYIQPVNDPPTVQDTELAALVGLETPIDLQDWIHDVDGDTVHVVRTYPPTHGTLAGTGDSRTYAPLTGFSGLDSFKLEASDGKLSASGKIWINVRPWCTSIACADRAETTEDTPVTIDALANDGREDSRCAIAGVESPTYGTAEARNNQILYTPPQGYAGADLLRYSVVCCGGFTGQAQVWVMVRPVNSPPQVFDEWVATPMGTAVTVDVLANDVDPDGEALRIDSVQAVEVPHGQISRAGGSVTYQPMTGFTGIEVLEYLVSDNHEQVAGRLEVYVGVDIPPAEEDGEEATNPSEVAVTELRDWRHSLTMLATDKYVVALVSETDGAGNATRYWIQGFALTGEPPWERELPAKPTPALHYLWGDLLVCSLSSGNVESVLDARNGKPLYEVSERAFAFKDQYLVTDQQVFDLAAGSTHFWVQRPTGMTTHALAIIGDQVLYWNETAGLPLLVTLSDGSKSWHNLAWDPGALEALQQARGFAPRRVTPNDEWSTPRNDASVFDGFPILLPRRGEADGQLNYYFFTRDGKARLLTPEDLGVADPALDGGIESELLWSGRGGPLLLVGFRSASRTAMTFVALDGSGSHQGKLVLPVGPGRLGESPSLQFHGLDAQGNLILVTQQDIPNPGAMDFQPYLHTISSYRLPGLLLNFSRELQAKWTDRTYRLLGSELFISGDIDIIYSFLLGLDVGHNDSQPAYRLTGYDPCKKGEVCWADGDPAAHNAKYLFLPQVTYPDEPRKFRLLSLSRDVTSWPLPPSCEISYPQPAFTESDVALTGPNCLLPISYSVPPGAGTIKGSTWHTPATPGTYPVTADVSGRLLIVDIPVEDIRLVRDSDKDGLVDHDEDLIGTNPNLPDHDKDGVGDGADVSPLIDPADPGAQEWKEFQKPGMVRIDLDLRIYALDGRVDIYDIDVQDGSKRFVRTCYSGCLMDSDGTLDNVDRTLNASFAEQGLQVAGLQRISPYVVGAAPCDEYLDPKAHERLSEGTRAHPTEYDFLWTESSRFVRASLTNNGEIHYPDAKSFYRYLLIPVALHELEQLVTFQYLDAAVSRKYYYVKSAVYRMPAWQYALYTADQLAAGKPPVTQGMVFASPDPTNDQAFSFQIQLPKSGAGLESPFLKLTPVWVEANGSDAEVSPSEPRLALTGLKRQVTYLLPGSRENQTITQHLGSLALLNQALPVLGNVLAAGTGPGATTTTEEYGRITVLEAGTGQERADLVTTMVRTVIRLAHGAAGPASDIVDLQQDLVKANYKLEHKAELEKWEDLPPGHWARKKTVRGAWLAISVAGYAADIVTDGVQVRAAIKKGDKVSFAYYFARVAVNTAFASSTIAEASVELFGIAKEGSKAADVGKLAGAAAWADVALDVMQVSYDLYRYENADDPFLKNCYGEQVYGDLWTLVPSIIVAICRLCAAVPITWNAILYLYSLKYGEDMTYRALKNAAGIPFLVKYFNNDVPTEMAKEAMNSLNKEIQEELTADNARYAQGELRYLSILLGPKP